MTEHATQTAVPGPDPAGDGSPTTDAAPQIVLDRPRDVRLDEGLSLFDGLIGVTYEDNHARFLPIRVLGGAEHLATPDEVRDFGAKLIALADLAAAEPDPAEIADLTKVIENTHGDPAALARALLRRYTLTERGHA